MSRIWVEYNSVHSAVAMCARVMDPRSHRWAMHTSVHIQYVLVEYYKARHTMSVVGMKGFEKLFK